MFTFDDILFSPRQLCQVSLAIRSIQSANIEASPIDMLDGESSVERRGTHPTSPAMINRAAPFSVVVGLLVLIRFIILIMTLRNAIIEARRQ